MRVDAVEVPSCGFKVLGFIGLLVGSISFEASRELKGLSVFRVSFFVENPSPPE